MSRPSSSSRFSRQAQRSTRKRARWILGVSLASVVVLVISFSGFSRELIRQYNIKKDVEEVQKEIAALEKQNEDLSYLVEYLNTDAAKEIQARQSLGLKRNGETVVAVESASSDARSVSANSGEIVGAAGEAVTGATEGVPAGQVTEGGVEGDASPIRSWWEYFFSPQDL